MKHLEQREDNFTYLYKMKYIHYNKTRSSEQFGGYNTINLIPRLHYTTASIGIAWLGISIFIRFK